MFAARMFTLLRGMSKVRAFAARMLSKAASLTLLPNAPWEMAPVQAPAVR
jgi:hypothetical protein